MGLAARKLQVALSADTAVDAEVDLGTAGDAYFLQCQLAWFGAGGRAGLGGHRAPDLPLLEGHAGNINVAIHLV
jgi:hypothetical protein